MHQSVVEYDVAPCTMTAVHPAGDDTIWVSRRLPCPRRSAANTPLLAKASRGIAGSLASYLSVVAMAAGLVAAWAALCSM